MVGGILYEHSHRMIAATVGLLTIILNLWLWRRESRLWVRRLGLIALAALVTQGVLGGVTVLYSLPTTISVLHACLAQIFFCLILALVVATQENRRPSLQSGDSSLFSCRLPWVTTLGVFLQLLLGAAVRHSGTLGGNKGVVLVPSALVAHLVGAIVVAVLIVYWVVSLLNIRQEQKLGYLMLGLLVAQISLGLGAYLVRWFTAKGLEPLWGSVLITTSHVAAGTLLLGASLVLALRVRPEFVDRAGWVSALQESDAGM